MRNLDQDQRRVIIRADCDEHDCSVLHTKQLAPWPSGYGEGFKGFYNIYGHGDQIRHVTRTPPRTFHFPPHMYLDLIVWRRYLKVLRGSGELK